MNIVPVKPDALTDNYVIDGRKASHVFAPASAAEASENILQAAGEGIALVPWGGGTSIEQGNTLKGSQWAAVSSAKLAEVVEFSPDDMVVTMGTGLSLAKLQEALRERGQYLPIDAPFEERATMGGIVATNGHGLWRPAFGTPRDRLLGVRVVMADGSQIRGGGKVVKNVAGYDLCKLFSGSWGTLGFITEVTFKTNPLPETRRRLLFQAESIASAVEAGLTIHTERLQPEYLSVISQPVLLCVGLMGSEQSVAWQEERIGSLLEEAGLTRTEEGPSEADLRHYVSGSNSAVQGRITARPTDLPQLLHSLQGYSDRLIAHIPVGVIEFELNSEELSLAQAIRQNVSPFGHLVWTRVREIWKQSMDVWGPAKNDFALMQGIKKALDPQNVFSPGRFLGRL